ncbi:hypothetical protein [Zavarzinella formosa]|uniref:hypothetical protein n=1 Tax=Zavarzinella formosa TaxID=360055 RepID=UPI0002D75597|nr:hypothetical protein [Zavarzinella formosa]
MSEDSIHTLAAQAAGDVLAGLLGVIPPEWTVTVSYLVYAAVRKALASETSPCPAQV